MAWRERTRGTGRNGLLRALTRSSPIIVATALVVAGLVLFLSLRQDERYTASALLDLRTPTLDESAFDAPLDRPDAPPERTTETEAGILASRSIADRAAQQLRRLGRPELVETIYEDMDVSLRGGSDIAEVRATAPSADGSAAAANAYVAAYLADRRSTTRGQLRRLQASLRGEVDRIDGARFLAADVASGDRGGTADDRRTARRRLSVLTERAQALEAQIEDLRIQQSVPSPGAEVVEDAIAPDDPSAPKTLRNVLLGAGAGLLLGIAVALLLDRRRRRFSRPEELAELFGAPIMARIPPSRALESRGLPDDLASQEMEAFRMLRASLRHFRRDTPPRSVLITSPTAGDGKSTIALNLAVATAATGARVLLVEADVRKPALAHRFDLTSEEGLAEVLSGRRALAEVVRQLPVPPAPGLSSAVVDLLLAGRYRAGAGELFGTPSMRSLLDEIEPDYDLVVIDTPPPTMVADTVPLLTMVAAVIVVTGIGDVRPAEAKRLAELLEQTQAPTAGLVINFDRTAREGRYYYGYDSDERAPRQPENVAADRRNGSAHPLHETEAEDEVAESVELPESSMRS